MRMKEDAMLNGQLKPAYNLQHGVNLLMTEVTSLYLPCGRTTLLSVFHIRLFA